ncbi:MAG: hypothetical protein B6226_00240 [Candidatus Cloacimonetes bacterium 4572_65]|nr:MAG: hypothetical protein B6226_00240 [Candidatus Cloacimonetes bacterium 4572_65]
MKKEKDINQAIVQIKKELRISPNKCLNLADSIVKHIDLVATENNKANIFFQLAQMYSSLSDIKESIVYFKKALDIFEKLGDKNKITLCYYYIGYRTSILNLSQEAVKYFTLSFRLSSEIKNSTIQSDSALRLGIIYTKLGEHEKALRMLFYSLRTQPNSDNDNQECRINALNNIGICFTELKLYTKAIEYHIEAIEICQKTNNTKLLASVYNNISITYRYSKNYSPALDYNFKSLNLSKKNKHYQIHIASLINIGEIYIIQKKYKHALKFFLEAREFIQGTDYYSLAVVLFNLANTYNKLKELDKIKENLEEAIDLAQKINIMSVKKLVYEGAKDIYFELKSYQKAFIYQEKFYAIKEAILNEDLTKKKKPHKKRLYPFNSVKEPGNTCNFQKIIGHSEEMVEIFTLINMIAEHNVNVMILGPTGCGKELIARAIHNKYKQKAPLVTINCSAIPEHLLESELFGYVKGAFTGASKSKKGKIEMANNGTLFLDEIGDMPLSLQSKILRVIQERQFTPVGGTKPIIVSIRIISATHRNLMKLIETKEFRQDLYYRLNVIKIDIPALKDRKLDIPHLVNHFIRKFNAKFNKEIQGISINALSYLLSLPWLGNVRELENEVEKAVLLCIQETLHIELFSKKTKNDSVNIYDKLPIKWSSFKLYKAKINDKLDLTYTNKLLSETNNNFLEASKIGEINKSQLYRILKKNK